jgi:hypothetical protein
MTTMSNKQAFHLGLFFGLGFAIAGAVVALVPVLVAGLGK